MKPIAKIVLDTRRALDSGQFPVKIRIMFKPKQYSYYATGEEMFKEEFAKLYTAKALQDRLSALNKQLAKATSIIEQKPFISKEAFDLIFSGKGNYESVQGLFDILQAEASKNNQIGTAALYQTVKNSLTKFVKSETPDSDGTLVLGEITVEFLERYEAYLLNEKRSYNTIGIYTRYIRELFNWAIEDLNLTTRDKYPFGRRKFIPPATTARKIALTEAQKNVLLRYQSEYPIKQKAVDFWKLSFFCFGLNFKDICHLKWSNIEDSLGIKVIRIYRAKTFGRKRVKSSIEIPVTDEIMAIIKKYGTISLDPNAFIFDVLIPGLTPLQEHYRKNDFIKDTNGQLKTISEDLGLPSIRTYSARHSFAHIMMTKGVSTPMIQQMLNHESQKTTENYMGSFEIQDKLTAAKLLYN